MGGSLYNPDLVTWSDIQNFLTKKEIALVKRMLAKPKRNLKEKS